MISTLLLCVISWAEVTPTAKPWAYNWWMASAVDAEGLEHQCAAMEKAGFGGFHVIPIYGAKGYETKYREYLSSEWIDAWNLAVRTARKHHLGVDITMGSGWCFGGPWITEKDAASSRMLVKRAGPGGRGFMIDPFSPSAMSNFVARFETVFGRGAQGVERPRAFYHDSYEYLGAMPKHGGDWDELQYATFGVWTKWCRDRGYLTRNEAHGAPGNWLDLYALADIPETEMFDVECRDIFVSKFASSAAHVCGKQLVSSETGTWLCEHFHETLSELKILIDRLFLAGINHIFYHGLCYSPKDAVWPGWCFYAASEVNPRNTIWHDIDVLNAYVTRCQAMFQVCTPDADTLVYFPYSDSFAAVHGGDGRMSVHNAPKWFNSKPIGRLAKRLADEGCAFDYVSDRQLRERDLSRYARIVVPESSTVPAGTKAKIAAFHSREVRLEEWPKFGLSFTRFRRGNDRVYFVANTNAHAVACRLESAERVVRLNPMTGEISSVEVLRLEAGASTFLQLPYAAKLKLMPAGSEAKSVCITTLKRFRLEPVAGGPIMPAPMETDELKSWHELYHGDEAFFSGTMRYVTTFDYSGPRKGTVTLDLGEVHESARVYARGIEVGAAIMAPYRVSFPAEMLRVGENELTIEVTSTAVNRIRWNDLKDVKWKYFTDANVTSLGYHGQVNATKWPPAKAGLIGPVSLLPAQE